MEIYEIFTWLMLSFLAIQLGFITGGLLSRKEINLPVVYACMFLVLVMFVGFCINKY